MKVTDPMYVPDTHKGKSRVNFSFLEPLDTSTASPHTAGPDLLTQHTCQRIHRRIGDSAMHRVLCEQHDFSHHPHRLPLSFDEHLTTSPVHTQIPHTYQTQNRQKASRNKINDKGIIFAMATAMLLFRAVTHLSQMVAIVTMICNHIQCTLTSIFTYEDVQLYFYSGVEIMGKPWFLYS